MSKKYLSIEEAAEILGMETSELNRLREKGEIRAFADRGTWKFKQEDIEKLGRSRQADSNPEVPLYNPTPAKPPVGDETTELVLGDEEDALSEQPTIIRRSQMEESSSDSDVRLVFDDNISIETDENDARNKTPLSDSDSDVRLASESGKIGKKESDSDVKLVKPESDSDVKLLGDTDSDSDVKLVSNSSIRNKKDSDSDSDVKLASPSDSDVRLVKGRGKVMDSDIKLAGPGDSDIRLDRDDESNSDVSLMPKNKSDDDDEEISLSFDDEEISLAPADEDEATINLASADDEESVLGEDSGISLSKGSSVLLSSESGISLDKPDDSGISLDESSEITLAGDSGISLDMGDEDSGITLDVEGDSGISPAGESGISLGRPGGSSKIKGGGSRKKGKGPGSSKKILKDDSDDELGSTLAMPEVPLGGDDDLLDTQMEVPLLSEDEDSFDLGGDDDDATSVITLDDEGDVDDYSATMIKKKGRSRDDDEDSFEEGAFGADDDDATGGSDSEALEVSDEIIGEDDELEELDVFGAEDEDFEAEVESGESHAELPIASARGMAPVVEQDWGIPTFVGLALSTALLIPCGLVMLDMVRSMWYTDLQQQNPATTGLLDIIKGFF